MKLSSEARAQLEMEAEEVFGEMEAGGKVPAVGVPAVIAALAMAIDRSVRIVVVVCGEVERVDSVARLLRAVTWPMVHASTEPHAWETELAQIRKQVAGRGLIVACAKNARHLDRVRELVERIEGGRYPALVIEEGPEELVSARTRARLDELRRLLRRVTMRG